MFNKLKNTISFLTECKVPTVTNGKYEVSESVTVTIEGVSKDLPQQLILKCDSGYVSNPASRVADCTNKEFNPIEECVRGYLFLFNFFMIV